MKAHEGIYLDMALAIKEDVLGLNVPVRDALGVQVLHAVQDLLEAALDLGRGHAALWV